MVPSDLKGQRKVSGVPGTACTFVTAQTAPTQSRSEACPNIAKTESPWARAVSRPDWSSAKGHGTHPLCLLTLQPDIFLQLSAPLAVSQGW